jgi:integrase
MNQENILVKIVKQTRKDIDGFYSIALRVMKNRRKKEIQLNLKCKDGEFENQEFTKAYPDYKLHNEFLLKRKTKALKIIREFQLEEYDFTLDEFEDRFKGKKKQSNIRISKVIDYFDKVIAENFEVGKVATARGIKETRNSLYNFAGNKITFNDVTPLFLNKYEIFLREKDNATGGVAFKMRTLRTIYNKAISEKVASQELYPFREYKISKLKPEPNKRALSSKQIRKIIDLDLTENPHLIDSHNYFIFSFHTRGMNFVDIMKLKWSDINNGRISYTRSKTNVPFDIEILEPVQKIIDYYSSRKDKFEYVFPILNTNEMTPIQIDNRKKRMLQKTNKDLKEIASLAGIKIPLTTYVARHSFATILKDKGTSVEKISELMGHSNVNVTMTYLKDFDNETLDLENRKLLNL